MNKKGLGPLVIPIFLGVMILGGIMLGSASAFQINEIFSSPWIIAIIFFLIFFLLSGGKKRK